MILLGYEFHCVLIVLFVFLLYDDVCVALLNVLLLSEVFHFCTQGILDGVCLFVCVCTIILTERESCSRTCLRISVRLPGEFVFGHTLTHLPIVFMFLFFGSGVFLLRLDRCTAEIF